MHMTLIAVGRSKSGPLREIYDHYAGRLGHGPLGPLALKEVEERRPLSPEELKRREAELLLGAAPKGARLVALDEAGKVMTSAGFAGLLGRWRDEGVRDIAFLVGGAEGLDGSVPEAAALTLSLGPMTWPHLLARALLAEQLYRAQSILTGHPYHRE
ncbi:MAG: 23S rRNA (pseudouridine(1915)-N(3))-methyltransferase RlmH [Proteobacteria bacterium]|nr:23S rRNA (pseudouridine(1915)-N(3))-methyltransferase RlmH [Pseudomonadota bacterium]